MKAVKVKIVNFEENMRSTKDKRKKIAWLVVEYRSAGGYEYRRSFEAEPFTCPQKMFAEAPTEIEVSE
jgi:hypothetical protein